MPACLWVTVDHPGTPSDPARNGHAKFRPSVLHTGYVHRHPSDEERRGRIDAYLAGAADEEKGAVLLALLGHAVIFLLLSAVETIWVGSTVVRAWRRRELGVTQAIRTGVHKPSLVVLFAVHVLYLLLRKAGLAKLDQRSIEYMVDKREGSDP